MEHIEPLTLLVITDVLAWLIIEWFIYKRLAKKSYRFRRSLGLAVVLLISSPFIYYYVGWKIALTAFGVAVIHLWFAYKELKTGW